MATQFKNIVTNSDSAIEGNVPSLRCVADRCQLNESQNAASVRFINSRSSHHNRSGTTLNSLRVVIANFKGNELLTGGALTVSATIEYPLGVYNRMTFNTGNRSAVVADKAFIVSDEIPMTVPIPPDAVFWFRTFQANPGGVMYNAFQPSATMGDGMYFASTPIADVTDATLNTSAGAANASCIRPTAIIGYGKRPALVFIGDSRGKGSLDSTVDEIGYSGYFERSYGANYPFINLCVAGDSMFNFTLPNQSTVRQALAKQFGNIVINGYGGNDVAAVILNRTLAQVQGYVTLFNGLFPDMPIFNVTLSPRTTSSDAFATLVNQTLDANEAARAGYNNWIRSSNYFPSEGKGISGFIDIADVSEDKTSAGRWVVNGAANYATPDGTHENTFFLKNIIAKAYQMRPDIFFMFS